MHSSFAVESCLLLSTLTHTWNLQETHAYLKESTVLYPSREKHITLGLSACKSAPDMHQIHLVTTPPNKQSTWPPHRKYQRWEFKPKSASKGPFWRCGPAPATQKPTPKTRYPLNPPSHPKNHPHLRKPTFYPPKSTEPRWRRFWLQWLKWRCFVPLWFWVQ